MHYCTIFNFLSHYHSSNKLLPGPPLIHAGCTDFIAVHPGEALPLELSVFSWSPSRFLISTRDDNPRKLKWYRSHWLMMRPSFFRSKFEYFPFSDRFPEKCLIKKRSGNWAKDAKIWFDFFDWLRSCWDDVVPYKQLCVVMARYKGNMKQNTSWIN